MLANTTPDVPTSLRKGIVTVVNSSGSLLSSSTTSLETAKLMNPFVCPFWARVGSPRRRSSRERVMPSWHSSDSRNSYRREVGWRIL